MLFCKRFWNPQRHLATFQVSVFESSTKFLRLGDSSVFALELMAHVSHTIHAYLDTVSSSKLTCIIEAHGHCPRQVRLAEVRQPISQWTQLWPWCCQSKFQVNEV